jgi:ketosteroid isomerase-like protein
MAVLNAADMNAAFAAAVSSGEVENLLVLYEPDALLAPEPGKRARGHAEIRAALGHLLALGGTMESRNNYCLEVGELALLQGEWTLTGKAPDGTPFEVSSRTAEVVRRQPDGSWLYVVDHAFAND